MTATEREGQIVSWQDLPRQGVDKEEGGTWEARKIIHYLET